MEKENNINNIILILLILGIIIYISSILSETYILSQINKEDIPYINSHKTCPVMGGETNYTGCIHYPPLNLAFIASVCCKSCIATIQKSFKNDDNEYSIQKVNDTYYLTKDGVHQQIVRLCNYENTNYLFKHLKTKSLQD
tara:strand:+ start:278 stop:697 length:420 start_codon:yes stop_codon:yes gene_type:complete